MVNLLNNKKDIYMKTKEIVLPENWEVKEVKGNKIILKEKEKELPKTWKECAIIIDDVDTVNVDSEIKSFDISCLSEPIDETDYKIVPEGLGKPMLALCRLLICRNAWWKQLGWEPNWEMPDEKHCIVFKCDGIEKQVKTYEGCVLAFPKYEVRDQFLYSFRNLIEEAKELL